MADCSSNDCTNRSTRSGSPGYGYCSSPSLTLARIFRLGEGAARKVKTAAGTVRRRADSITRGAGALAAAGFAGFRERADELRAVELAAAGIVVGPRVGELFLHALILERPFVRRSARRWSP